MKCASFVAAVAIAAAVVITASPARAEPTRILVIPNEETKGIGARLSAELRTLGFEVVVADRPMAETGRETLEDAAREVQAVAALFFRASRAGVEVWVMDRVTQKTVLREVVVPKSGDDALVAVRAVELLRASLLEVEAPAFVPGEAAPTPATLALVSRPPPRAPSTAFEIGPAFSLSPGGVTAAPHFVASLRWHAASRFDLGVTTIAPIIPAVVDGPEGRSTVTLTSSCLVGDLLLLPRDATYGARAGLGVGLLWTHLEGSSSPGFRGRGEDVFTSLWLVHAGVSRALGTSVRLWLDATLAITAPRLVVRFAGRDVAEWGRPAVLGAAGLELPFL